MKLLLNPDKTTIVVFSRPAIQIWKDEINIKDQNEVIKPVSQICLLGWRINERLSQDTNLNITIGVVNKNSNNLKPLEQYLNSETRAKLYSIFMISRINYGLPQFLGETVEYKY